MFLKRLPYALDLTNANDELSLRRQNTYSWSSFRNQNSRNWKSCHAWKDYEQFCRLSTRMFWQKWTSYKWCDFSQLWLFFFCTNKWQCTSNIKILKIVENKCIKFFSKTPYLPVGPCIIHVLILVPMMKLSDPW